MRAVFLVPRRVDGGHRDKLWAWCRAKWEREHPDIQIFEGHHVDGPFNRSAAINLAAELAGDWDVGIVIDADVMVDAASVQRAVARAAKTGHVVWAFTQWQGLTPGETDRLMRQGDLGPLTEKPNPISWSCCFAIPRAVWDDWGGFDERFRGWGFEDMAAKAVIETRYGSEHLKGAVTHLWHPRSETRAEVRRPDGMILITPEYLENTVLGRRYMDAEGVPEVIDRLVADAKAARQQSRSSIALVVLTNGRQEYIAQAIASAEARLKGNVAVRRIWDDSASPAYRDWLREQFPEYRVVGPASHFGYSATMAALFSYLTRKIDTRFVFLLEEDFVIERDVDLDEMGDVLNSQLHLAQLALLRDAFYPREIEAGGIVQQKPDAYAPRNLNGYGWLEHREFWTNNPTLFRRSLCKMPWPTTRPHSEAEFGRQLIRDPDLRFAFWGSGETWTRHIGVERTGDGY